MSTPFKVEGVDYSPEGIEGVRLDLIGLRNDAMQHNAFGVGMMLSHVIALLAHLKELVEQKDSRGKQ